MHSSTAQQYQNYKFLNHNQQQLEQLNNINQNGSNSPESSSSSGSSDGTSSLSSTSSANKKRIQQQRQKSQSAYSNKSRTYDNMPHYWPADRVPYINVSYCQLIQYIFAFMFISVLIWIFVGLKHFGEKNENNDILSPQKIQIQNINNANNADVEKIQSFGGQIQKQIQKQQSLRKSILNKNNKDKKQQQQKKQLINILREQAGLYQKKKNTKNKGQIDIDFSHIQQNQQKNEFHDQE